MTTTAPDRLPTAPAHPLARLDALPRAFTVDEIAKEYRMDRSTVCAEIKAGRLKAGRAGRRYVVLASAVVEWMSRVSP